MTKSGTPIGLGPNGAIVVVGLAWVGTPPLVYCEPPLPPTWVCSCTPSVALGATTPPPELPPPSPLASPMLLLWWTSLPPVSASIVESLFGLGLCLVGCGAGTGVAVDGASTLPLAVVSSA